MSGVGVPVGAVRLRPRDAHAFRQLLQSVLQERIRFRGVDRDDGHETLTLHLPPIAAASLDDEHPELIQFLDDRNGVYLAGLRRECPTRALSPPPEDAGDALFRFVELFAGVGGFRLGLERPEVGGKCVLSNEINEYACSIYRDNFRDSPSCLAVGDVLDIDTANVPDFDMLVGGFPCQPFSKRGDRKGLEDHRGLLYRELGRFLRDRQPKCFLFENVNGLVTIGGGWRAVRARGEMPQFTPGEPFRRILDAFGSCGYKVDWKVLNSRKWLPQMRERVYIIGTRADLGAGCERFNWDDLVLEELGEEDASTVRAIMEPKDSPSVVASELTPSQFETARRAHSKRGALLSECGRIDPDRKAPTLISRYRTVNSITTKFLFEEADGTRCDGVGGHRRPRFLTPRECTRLMGFPEDFAVPAAHDSNEAISQYYLAIGNAVCPPIVAAIGKELMRVIRSEL